MKLRAADLRRVDLHLARRGLDQALDHVGRLGPAGAAVGVDRRGVGEHRRHFAVDRAAWCTGPASSVAYRMVGMHEAKVDR